MACQSAVVLSIDRLGAAWLGPYGNTWLETPAFNRLAAESLLCETVLADSPDLAQACRAWWKGQHVLANDAASTTPRSSLPELAKQAGVEAVLATDDPAVAAHPLAATFSRQIVVEQPQTTGAAEEPDQTGLFHLMQAAVAALAEQNEPLLLWIHSRGMAGPWDAPQPMREQFADEEDPEPPAFVQPPELRLAEDYDPDALLGLVHGYAGQVALTDLALAVLLAALEEHPLRDQTLLAVTSPRGYPLGEHRRVGPCDEALYGELLHVPLLARLPHGRGRLWRSQQIVQRHDVWSLISEACGWVAAASSSLLAEVGAREFAPRELAVCVGPAQRAVRTPAWFLRESQREGSRSYELFAKPDDRYEANEIASRGRDIVELLAAQLDGPEGVEGSGSLAQSSPLPELLTDVWR